MAAAGTLMGGRPLKPEEERLSEVMNVRVTKTVADAVIRRAIKARMSVHEYVRRVLTEAVSVSKNPGNVGGGER